MTFWAGFHGIHFTNVFSGFSFSLHLSGCFLLTFTPCPSPQPRCPLVAWALLQLPPLGSDSERGHAPADCDCPHPVGIAADVAICPLQVRTSFQPSSTGREAPRQPSACLCRLPGPCSSRHIPPISLRSLRCPEPWPGKGISPGCSALSRLESGNSC